jgi:hypothetical protein
VCICHINSYNEVQTRKYLGHCHFVIDKTPLKEAKYPFRKTQNNQTAQQKSKTSFFE